MHLASHHGSRNGDTRAALARLNPRVVVISAGANNQYGHPHPEALALYAGATVVRTDVHGRIVIQAEPDGQYEVRVQQAGNVPRAPPAPATPPAAAPRAAPAPTAGCVDVNRASHQELDLIIHIGPARADAIVQLRATAPFRSVADLTRVSGIGPARLADIRAQGLACVR